MLASFVANRCAASFVASRWWYVNRGWPTIDDRFQNVSSLFQTRHRPPEQPEPAPLCIVLNLTPDPIQGVLLAAEWFPVRKKVLTAFLEANATHALQVISTAFHERGKQPAGHQRAAVHALFARDQDIAILCVQYDVADAPKFR